MRRVKLEENRRARPDEVPRTVLPQVCMDAADDINASDTDRNDAADVDNIDAAHDVDAADDIDATDDVDAADNIGKKEFPPQDGVAQTGSRDHIQKRILHMLEPQLHMSSPPPRRD